MKTMKKTPPSNRGRFCSPRQLNIWTKPLNFEGFSHLVRYTNPCHSRMFLKSEFAAIQCALTWTCLVTHTTVLLGGGVPPSQTRAAGSARSAARVYVNGRGGCTQGDVAALPCVRAWIRFEKFFSPRSPLFLRFGSPLCYEPKRRQRRVLTFIGGRVALPSPTREEQKTLLPRRLEHYNTPADKSKDKAAKKFFQKAVLL